MENTQVISTDSGYPDIPAEKFEFAKVADLEHDKKFDTKPVGYFKGAFKRFCKNKGAIVAACVIIVLILFALIVPFCTPYTVKYYDSLYKTVLPRNKLFLNTSFWDGCMVKTVNKDNLVEDYAIGAETGHLVVKDNKWELTSDGLYKYRYDTYFAVGCGGNYKNVSEEEYLDIQAYQLRTGIQVIYPSVALKDRPGGGDPYKSKDAEKANYYYKTVVKNGRTQAVLSDADDITSVIPVYWTYKESVGITGLAADYNSLCIEGEEGFKDEDGDTAYYVYARHVAGNQYEIRVSYYEYYTYRHTQVYKDGITEPHFLLGTDINGKDILTCLASGARFSFIFAVLVAIVNMLVGAIYGSIEGYYGGKLDLIMERISDILVAVPFMIIITLLKLHMADSSNVLILFIAFFLTGWIGMASTTRMQFYRFKNQEYVLAARTLGAKDRRIMFKHIFPNAIGTLVTSCALVIPSMIYTETNLTYLNILDLDSGNITSVGTLIANGQSVMATFPHAVLFPSVLLVLLMLSFNLFGNGLRDAFNPSLRGAEG